jgi:hypothetical protein
MHGMVCFTLLPGKTRKNNALTLSRAQMTDATEPMKPGLLSPSAHESEVTFFGCREKTDDEISLQPILN